MLRSQTTFEVRGGSLWPAGEALGTGLGPVFVGPTWNFAPTSTGDVSDMVIPRTEWGLFSIPAIHLGKTGVKIGLRGAGRIGFDVQPGYNGGTVDLRYHGGVTVDVPQSPVPGQRVTVSARFSPGEGSWFRTTSPRFRLGMSAVADASGAGTAEAWLFGQSLSNGNLFDPFNSTTRAPLFTDKSLDSATDRSQITSLLGPGAPGAGVSSPTVDVYGQVVDSAGVMGGEGFSKFLSVDTSLTNWIKQLLSSQDVLSPILDGTVVIPGTDVTTNWTVGKASINGDLGFAGRFLVRPRPVVELDIYREDGSLLAHGGTAVSFTMPAGPISVVPRLTLDLDLGSVLGVGTSGNVALSPFRATAAGTFGTGSDQERFDADFDPARQDWSASPFDAAKFKDSTTRLTLLGSNRATTMPTIRVNPSTLTELPREIFAGDISRRVAEIPAFAADPGTELSPRFTLNLVPEAGRSFLASNSNPGLRPEVTVRLRRLGAEDDLVLTDTTTTNQLLQVRIPSSLLKPGQATLTIGISTFNDGGQPRQATYVVPVVVAYPVPVIDGDLYASPDLTSTSATNRLVPSADGSARWLYFSARNLTPLTEAVINGSIVLPTTIGDDQLVAGTVGIRISEELVRRLGGSMVRLQLRSPGLLSNPDGSPAPMPYSATKDLFFPAPSPSLTEVRLDTQANPTVPVSDRAVWLNVVGSGFSPASTAVLNRGTSRQVDLPTQFSAPTSLRVQVPRSVMSDRHTGLDFSPSLSVRTPSLTVPAKGPLARIQSGGVSEARDLKFDYPVPRANSIRAAKVVRQANTFMRVTGDNLFKRSERGTTTKVLIDGDSIPDNYTIYPASSGLGIPYLDVYFYGGMSSVKKNGLHTLQLVNTGRNRVAGPLIPFYVQNATPIIEAGPPATIWIAPGRTNTISFIGGPNYSDTIATINGSTVPVTSRVINKMTVSIPPSIGDAIDATSVPLNIFNPAPGGGTSNPLMITVLERDPSRIRILLGDLTRDSASDTWVQVVRFQYTGKRLLKAPANLVVRQLPTGVTLISQTGTSAGSPVQAISLNGNVLSIARLRFRRPAGQTGPIPFSPVIQFED